MATNGGVKLRLEPAISNDRRIRHAEVDLTVEASGEVRTLITDAKGRMNYRLDDGNYRLSVLGGPAAEFQVAGQRWTSLRLALI